MCTNLLPQRAPLRMVMMLVSPSQHHAQECDQEVLHSWTTGQQVTRSGFHCWPQSHLYPLELHITRSPMQLTHSMCPTSTLTHTPSHSPLHTVGGPRGPREGLDCSAIFHLPHSHPHCDRERGGYDWQTREKARSKTRGGTAGQRPGA